MSKTGSNDRPWDSTFQKWVGAGCPNNDPDNPIPEKHPEQDHPWNVDREDYLKKLKISWKKDDEEE